MTENRHDKTFLELGEALNVLKSKLRRVQDMYQNITRTTENWIGWKSVCESKKMLFSREKKSGGRETIPLLPVKPNPRLAGFNTDSLVLYRFSLH